MKKIVLGVGNLLLSDEGFGVHVVKRLGSEGVPQDTQVFDGGTASWYALPSIEEAEKLIVIDAVKGGGEPGSVYKIRVDDFGSGLPSGVSLHEVGLLEALSWLRSGPEEVVIFGVEPKKLDWGMELSDELKSKVPVVTGLVQTELRKC